MEQKTVYQPMTTEDRQKLQENLDIGAHLWHLKTDDATAFENLAKIFTLDEKATHQIDRLKLLENRYQQANGFYSALNTALTAAKQSNSEKEPTIKNFFNILLDTLTYKDVEGTLNGVFPSYQDNLEVASKAYLLVWNYFFLYGHGVEQIYKDTFNEFSQKAKNFLEATKNSPSGLDVNKCEARAELEKRIYPPAAVIVSPNRRILNKIWGFKENDNKTGWAYAGYLFSGTVFAGFTLFKRLLARPLHLKLLKEKKVNDWRERLKAPIILLSFFTFLLKLIFWPDKLRRDADTGWGKLAIVLTNGVIWFCIGLALPPLLGFAGWTWTMGYLPGFFSFLEIANISAIQLFVGFVGLTYSLLYQVVNWVEKKFEVKPLLPVYDTAGFIPNPRNTPDANVDKAPNPSFSPTQRLLDANTSNLTTPTNSFEDGSDAKNNPQENKQSLEKEVIDLPQQPSTPLVPRMIGRSASSGSDIVGGNWNFLKSGKLTSGSPVRPQTLTELGFHYDSDEDNDKDQKNNVIPVPSHTMAPTTTAPSIAFPYSGTSPSPGQAPQVTPIEGKLSDTPYPLASSTKG